MKTVVKIGSIIATVAILVILILYIFRLNIVIGNSMEPTYYADELLICNRLAKENIKRGDVIVFYNPGTNDFLIKRVIALQGESISIHDNKVYINSSMLVENYLKYEHSMNDIAEIKVPNNKIFVLGDNRDYSLDSRNNKVSFVDKLNIYGKVILNLSDIGVTKDNYLVYLLGLSIAMALIINTIVIRLEKGNKDNGSKMYNKDMLNLLSILAPDSILNCEGAYKFVEKYDIDLKKELQRLSKVKLTLQEKINIIVLDTLYTKIIDTEYTISIIKLLAYYANKNIQINFYAFKNMLVLKDVHIDRSGKISGGLMLNYYINTKVFNAIYRYIANIMHNENKLDIKLVEVFNGDTYYYIDNSFNLCEQMTGSNPRVVKEDILKEYLADKGLSDCNNIIPETVSINRLKLFEYCMKKFDKNNRNIVYTRFDLINNYFNEITFKLQTTVNGYEMISEEVKFKMYSLDKRYKLLT